MYGDYSVRKQWEYRGYTVTARVIDPQPPYKVGITLTNADGAVRVARVCNGQYASVIAALRVSQSVANNLVDLILKGGVHEGNEVWHGSYRGFQIWTQVEPVADGYGVSYLLVNPDWIVPVDHRHFVDAIHSTEAVAHLAGRRVAFAAVDALTEAMSRRMTQGPAEDGSV